MLLWWTMQVNKKQALQNKYILGIPSSQGVNVQSTTQLTKCLQSKRNNSFWIPNQII